MASSSLNIDNILIQTRCCLQSEGIKLWLEPYYLEGIGPNDAELETLAKRLSYALNIPNAYVLPAITELQSHALDKLKARGTFNDSGLATIKIRVSAKVNGGRLITVQTRLDGSGEEFYKLVADKLNVVSNYIKLISAGKVIARTQTLSQQGIQNNQQIMAIVLEPDAAAQAAEEQKSVDMIQNARNDAAMLLEQDDSFLDMENQEGNVVHLPPAEKKAIMMALAMHEKGRAALKRDEYNEALVYFLEADADFKACSSTLLESVDNYALLNLDIVWCYVMLKNIGQLPDAESRLKVCEAHFKRSYGPNLDRVVSLKGNAVNERALIMRLHLLQAVLHFHQNMRSKACDLFDSVELEWQRLQISDESVRMMVDMGYTEKEARIGLRSSSNSIDNAITFILDRRETLKAARKKARAERRTKDTLTKTKNGSWVNPRTLHTLTEMGFDNNLCALALQKTDNDIDQTLTLLERNKDALWDELTKDVVVDVSLAKMLTSMGFDEETALAQLKRSFNNLQAAIDLLMQQRQDAGIEMPLGMHGVNVHSSISAPSTSAAVAASAEAEEAYDRFAEDLKNDDDEYLDLPLTAERALLDEYRRMLQK